MNSLTISPVVTKLPYYSSHANRLRPVAALQKKKAATDQFAHALAHEIRNPLSTIKLAGEMLISMISNNDQKSFLDMIIKGSVRINELLTDFLSSFETKETKSENHSLHQLLDDVLELSEDRIRLKNISIRKEYVERDCKIIMNRPKMKIALTNIIINAIDAMMPEKGELTLVTKSIGGNYTLQIEDNGCGISKENLKNIFNPYFTNKPGGLGIGLAATSAILRSNHVGVHVRSIVGEGTSFTLSFKNDHKQKNFLNVSSNVA